MSATKIRRVATLGVVAAALTLAAAVTPGVAAARPRSTAAPAGALSSCAVGQVPLTTKNGLVRFGPGLAFGTEYPISAWSGFRIVAGPASADGLVWWYGHGDGHSDGWLPQQDLSCN